HVQPPIFPSKPISLAQAVYGRTANWAVALRRGGHCYRLVAITLCTHFLARSLTNLVNNKVDTSGLPARCAMASLGHIRYGEVHDLYRYRVVYYGSYQSSRMASHPPDDIVG